MNIRNLVVLLLVIAAGVLVYRMGSDDVPQAAAGRAMVDVQVPELTPGEMRGQGAFETNCASCHGLNASGREGSGPPLVHKIYEPGHHGDAAFKLAVQNGVRGHHWRFGNMPPVTGLPPDDAAAIISYVRALQRANGIF